MRETASYKTECVYTALRVRKWDGAVKIRKSEKHAATIIADTEHDRFSILDENVGRMITVPAAAVFEALLQAGEHDPQTEKE